MIQLTQKLIAKLPSVEGEEYYLIVNEVYGQFPDECRCSICNLKLNPIVIAKGKYGIIHSHLNDGFFIRIRKIGKKSGNDFKVVCNNCGV